MYTACKVKWLNKLSTRAIITAFLNNNNTSHTSVYPPSLPLPPSCTPDPLPTGLAVYSSIGKLGIELSNIGLGIGTCVAFYIIIGDLLPPLVAKTLNLDWVSQSTMIYLSFPFL